MSSYARRFKRRLTNGANAQTANNLHRLGRTAEALGGVATSSAGVTCVADGAQWVFTTSLGGDPLVFPRPAKGERLQL